MHKHKSILLQISLRILMTNLHKIQAFVCIYFTHKKQFYVNALCCKRINCSY